MPSTKLRMAKWLRQLQHTTLSIALAGCATYVEGETAAAPIVEPSGRALRLGDSGQQVYAVYRYLADYGYFPNRELGVRYPGFTPLVERAPELDDVFDDRLELGVKLFQRNQGLPPNGVVDDSTRAAMTRERCSYPDGYVPGHAHVDADGLVDKFAVRPTVLFPDPIWTLESWPASVGETTFANLIEEMLNQWRSVHPSAIQRAARTNTEDRRIRIQFATLDGPRQGEPGCQTGCKAAEWNGAFRVLTVDSQENWAFNSNPTSTQVDFRTAILHELGHALFLEHSDNTVAVMTPFINRGTTRRALSIDDTMAIRSAFGPWGVVSTPTPAVFGVAVGSNDHFWILTNESSPGGLKIYRWNGSGWANVAGGAVTIAADSRGRAWAVNNVNEVYFSFSDFSGWRKLDQVCARNIDVAESGRVWIIGCDGHMWESPFDSGGTDSQIISQLSIGWRQWPMPGGRMPRAFATTSFTAASSQPVYLSTTGNEFWAMSVGAWFQIPLTGPINILDLGVGVNTVGLWAIESGTNKVYASNRQTPNANTGIPERTGWQVSLAPTSSLIEATRGGKPYVITRGFQLMTTLE